MNNSVQTANLSDLFTITNGNNLALDKQTIDREGIDFVSRSEQNNGIAGKIKPIDDLLPNPAGTITVALSGSVLSSFVQSEPYYTGYHVAVLTSKENLTLDEKLYYCECIKSNAYRYSYNRQANSTLGSLVVPAKSAIPEWVNGSVQAMTNSIMKKIYDFVVSIPVVEATRDEYSITSPTVTIADLFDVKAGNNLVLNNQTTDTVGINFISRSKKNNAVSGRIKPIVDLLPNPAGTITVALGGSVLASFVQLEPYYTGRDVAVLTPRYNFTMEEKLYYCECIKSNAYRYSYNHQANGTLRSLMIPAPNKIPEWVHGSLKNALKAEIHRKSDLTVAR